MEKLTAQEGRQVKAVAITTDPRGDTPASVRRFLSRRHAGGEIEYLLGSEGELRKLWKTFHVLSSLESGSHEMHSAPVRIYDRDLIWVATLHAGADLTESALLHDIRTALRVGAV
jgi:cytochrome oxidase Cu insertion factor (SCO1/SenC/PrrC family)